MDIQEFGLEFKEKEIQYKDDGGSDNIRYEEFLKRIRQKLFNQALKDEILVAFCVSRGDGGGGSWVFFVFFHRVWRVER